MKNLIKLVLLAVLGVFVLYPSVRTLLVSLQTDQGFSLENYEYIFSTAGSLVAIKNTLIMGAFTVLICGFIGTFLAFFVHYFDFPFKKLLDRVLLLPLVVPGLIIVFAFVQLYGESGMVTKTIQNAFGLEGLPYTFMGLPGILMVHAYTQYIYFYMNVSVAVKELDRSVIEAAMNLGASPVRVFWTIVLPFISPALISSGILTFMTGIGSFSAPNIIGGGFKVLTTQILLAKANLYMDLAAAQVVVLSLFAISYMLIARYYERKVSFQAGTREHLIQPVRIKNSIVKVIMSALAIGIIIMIFLPIVTIIVLSFVKPGSWMIEIFPREFSFDNYIRIFTRSRSLAPFMNSLRMALIAAFAAIVIAIPAAYTVTKTKTRLKPLLEILLMLPFALPASAIAINMINGFSSVLLGKWIMLPLAYFISMLPMAVRSVTISYQRLKDQYGEASMNLGANRITTFLKVTLPLVSPGIWSGFLLVFIRSLGEYTISAFLYTAANRPISIAMVNSVFEFQIGLAMAYGALVLLLTAIGSSILKRLQGNVE
ncbi:ABC transporter permease [Gudongella sp. DL1XJH-153]|uniref:ABC transporter permease n=1 Tax=Gudongella sp. DL1XJH-153 TaxID=3409804 RepID=UPI003BB6120A